jgi:hypothetical protein
MTYTLSSPPKSLTSHHPSQALNLTRTNRSNSNFASSSSILFHQVLISRPLGGSDIVLVQNPPFQSMYANSTPERCSQKVNPKKVGCEIEHKVHVLAVFPLILRFIAN